MSPMQVLAICLNKIANASHPTNSIIVDDKGLPSVMVYIPKFKMSDVITGGADSTHPMFIIDGVEKSGLYISKYQNKVYNGRAYSLPGEDPANTLNFETAMRYCTAKGTGWHLMTAMEWGGIALWCKKNGFLPYGNNNYGKDSRESNYVAVPTYTYNDSGTQRIGRVATGTGPVTWSHNNQLNGIYDLNGNVWEWSGGMRLVFGELQILENNNAANSANSQLAASAQWKAIKASDGTLITPDGTGTTSGSVKLDYISNVWTYTSSALTSAVDSGRGCSFVSATCDSTISDAAKALLYALAILPNDTAFDYQGDYFYANNGVAERTPVRGGYWNYGTSAGVFCTHLNNPRSYVSTAFGFRSAFYE